MSAKEIAARIVRPEIQAMHAYPVPDATGMVKLDTAQRCRSSPSRRRGHSHR